MYMNELKVFFFFGKGSLGGQEGEVGIFFHGLRWRRETFVFLVVLYSCAGCILPDSRRHHSHYSLSECHSLEFALHIIPDGLEDVPWYDSSMVSNDSS